MTKHSRFHRVVASVVLASFIAASTDGLAAQQPPPTTTTNETAAQGQRDAELMADTIGTGAQAGTGVVVGLFTGFIGTGIGYAVMGSKELSGEAALAQQGKSDDYQLGFKSAWAKKTKDKKRKSFLVGGLLGTAAWLAILASANSGDQY